MAIESLLPLPQLGPASRSTIGAASANQTTAGADPLFLQALVGQLQNVTAPNDDSLPQAPATTSAVLVVTANAGAVASAPLSSGKDLPDALKIAGDESPLDSGMNGLAPRAIRQSPNDISSPMVTGIVKLSASTEMQTDASPNPFLDSLKSPARVGETPTEKQLGVAAAPSHNITPSLHPESRETNKHPADTPAAPATNLSPSIQETWEASTISIESHANQRSYAPGQSIGNPSLGGDIDVTSSNSSSRETPPHPISDIPQAAQTSDALNLLPLRPTQQSVDSSNQLGLLDIRLADSLNVTPNSKDKVLPKPQQQVASSPADTPHLPLSDAPQPQVDATQPSPVVNFFADNPLNNPSNSVSERFGISIAADNRIEGTAALPNLQALATTTEAEFPLARSAQQAPISASKPIKQIFVGQSEPDRLNAAQPTIFPLPDNQKVSSREPETPSESSEHDTESKYSSASEANAGLALAVMTTPLPLVPNPAPRQLGDDTRAQATAVANTGGMVGAFVNRDLVSRLAMGAPSRSSFEDMGKRSVQNTPSIGADDFLAQLPTTDNVDTSQSPTPQPLLNNHDSGQTSVDMRGLTPNSERLQELTKSFSTVDLTSQQTSTALPPLEKPVGQTGWSDELGERVTWMNGRGLQQAEIHLNPPHLGPLEVRIDLNRDQQQANIQFVSPHAAVREALEAAVPKLREMLDSQQLSLVNVNVSQHSFADQREQRTGQWSFQQQENNSRSGGFNETGSGDESEAPTRRVEVGVGLLSLYA